MKKILFNHVNGKCERTSVHSSENGVARPLQPLNDRPLYQCMCRDFIGDKDRKWVSILSAPQNKTFFEIWRLQMLAPRFPFYTSVTHFKWRFF